jgi:hypothetical protein
MESGRRQDPRKNITKEFLSRRPLSPDQSGRLPNRCGWHQGRAHGGVTPKRVAKHVQYTMTVREIVDTIVLSLIVAGAIAGVLAIGAYAVGWF